MDFVVEAPMKFLTAAIGLVLAISVFGANPSFQSFAPADFTTNGYTIRIRPDVLTPPTTHLPNLVFDVYMDEHFGCGKNAGGQIGKYGWTQASGGGGGIELGTEPNHWGIARVRTTSLIGSAQTFFNADAMNTRPTIPPLSASTGWTNRIVWRLVGTNSCRIWIALTDATQFSLGAGARQQTFGVYMDTTNSNQIMGHTTTTATAGTTTQTNLGVLEDSRWYTNEFFSHISGVICFTLNNGALACVSNNITTEALIPAAAAVKTVDLTATNILEIDQWQIWAKRSP